ncbi:zf-HC2 domain-containing protein [Ciceribacter ferrooxidans]|uniref:Zf-HC2 domain-containing protein n=1 Tax=Ciceribacter ferrooxidans TaxID=2509717 RepID=A0A4Q2TEB5_9HYPH|nr:zf-HC2 domain-containing protein [Ciceribacter ferrooxidans]RYC15659.1 zf-HC2 domain-containing protein [Ciceribacter ferrooxidans]
MLNCWTATALASQAMDRELTMMERLKLKAHIAMCSGCRNFTSQVRDLRQMSRFYCSGAGQDERPKKQD